ncbi:hypothetical protein IM543_08050 [Massilia sp. UMI-21]|nr:hypothetical protein IM543_08050 [Massilia sp. UMI-21]
MSPIKSMIAVLFALGSAGALAQNAAPAMPPPPTGKPVDDSAAYGPVLDPQSMPATTERPSRAGSAPMAGSARPQAQEERAGQEPITGKPGAADPSARPAPQGTPPQQSGRAQQEREQPQTQQERQGRPERRQQAGKDKQAQRRPGAVQRIEGTPRIAVPVPPPPFLPAPARAVPAPVGPQTSQVVGCVGSGCTDAAGATYNAGGAGNTTVSSDGRLCTRNGANMQCL